MSHFGTTLKALMEKKRISGAELAKRTGLDASSVSRWANSRRNNIQPATLAKIAKHLGPEIVAAHVMDCGSIIKASPALLPQSGRNALDYLRQHMAHDRTLREAVNAIVALHKRHSV